MVGRSGFSFCPLTQTTEMYILAVIMLHQHKFCVYKGKKEAKITDYL